MSIGIDIPPVEDEEAATRLMIYHLQMAAAYFEATHNDRGRRANELIKAEMPEQAINAASSFVDVLCSYYEEISDEHPHEV